MVVWGRKQYESCDADFNPTLMVEGGQIGYTTGGIGGHVLQLTRAGLLDVTEKIKLGDRFCTLSGHVLYELYGQGAHGLSLFDLINTIRRKYDEYRNLEVKIITSNVAALVREELVRYIEEE